MKGGTHFGVNKFVEEDEGAIDKDWTLLAAEGGQTTTGEEDAKEEVEEEEE